MVRARIVSRLLTVVGLARMKGKIRSVRRSKKICDEEKTKAKRGLKGNGVGREAHARVDGWLRGEERGGIHGSIQRV